MCNVGVGIALKWQCCWSGSSVEIGKALTWEWLWNGSAWWEESYHCNGSSVGVGVTLTWGDCVNMGVPLS